MRVEFTLNGKAYAVRRGRRGDLVAEVFIPPHIDGGRGLHLRKPECWRPLNAKRFPRAVGRIIAAAMDRGLLA
ncbi:hypothetical protein ACWJKU_17185 [Methylocaldum sp. MU1018]